MNDFLFNNEINQNSELVVFLFLPHYFEGNKRKSKYTIHSLNYNFGVC